MHCVHPPLNIDINYVFLDATEVLRGFYLVLLNNFELSVLGGSLPHRWNPNSNYYGKVRIL